MGSTSDDAALGHDQVIEDELLQLPQDLGIQDIMCLSCMCLATGQGTSHRLKLDIALV